MSERERDENESCDCLLRFDCLELVAVVVVVVVVVVESNVDDGEWVVVDSG
jgi:hypothetical protein